MKAIFLSVVVVFLATTVTFSQQNQSRSNKNNSYSASNGITYHVGDTIKLGQGSAIDGSFNYLQMGGMYNTLNALSGDVNNMSSNIGRVYSGTNVIIKRIVSKKMKGAEKVYFVVGGGNLTNYNLMIEDAILSCEIADCNKTNEMQSNKYDDLLKLKELLDAGVISNEDFEKERVKILK